MTSAVFQSSDTTADSSDKMHLIFSRPMVSHFELLKQPTAICLTGMQPCYASVWLAVSGVHLWSPQYDSVPQTPSLKQQLLHRFVPPSSTVKRDAKK